MCIDQNSDTICSLYPHSFCYPFYFIWKICWCKSLIILQIKKFKDALAKHSPDRCSLGAPKGLEEKELVALSANKDLSFTYKPKPEEPVAVPEQEKIFTAPVSTSHLNSYPLAFLPCSLQSNTASKSVEEIKNKTLISSGRWSRQLPWQLYSCTVLLYCVVGGLKIS